MNTPATTINRKGFIAALFGLPFLKPLLGACGVTETARTVNPLPAVKGVTATTGSAQFISITYHFDEDKVDRKIIASRWSEPSRPMEEVFVELGIDTK